MEWSYGVTTVPERACNGLLERTLVSLARGGFDRPHLFVDGMFPGEWENTSGAFGQLPVTIHKEKIRAYGNWIMAAWELYIRKPHADRYAIFQDDCLTCVNLREYLSRCPYPERGYCNLYTFRQNEKPIHGWYESNQLGKGAVGLVFDNEAMRTLLSSRYMIDRPLNATRGHKAIDGGIVCAFKEIGWKEFVHNPSLLQHTGDVSAIGNGRLEKAATFRGIDFNAVDLLKETGVLRDPRTFRIGLVGYTDCETTRRLIQNTDVSMWLVRHKGNVLRDGLFDEVDFIFCPHGQPEKIRKFLNAVDVVIFHDDSPRYDGLVQRCKEQYKRIIAVTERGGGHEWLPLADLVLCTTVEGYNELKTKYPCAEFTWPGRWDTGAADEFNLLVRTGEHHITIV